jgi:hypothetical protein
MVLDWLNVLNREAVSEKLVRAGTLSLTWKPTQVRNGVCENRPTLCSLSLAAGTLISQGVYSGELYVNISGNMQRYHTEGYVFLQQIVAGEVCCHHFETIKKSMGIYCLIKLLF